MFVAKFSQTSGAPFESDKNGNYPFIGEVMCGKATGTLINGTMFTRDGLQPNKLYACENYTEDYEGTTQTRVRIVAEVSIVEYMSLRTHLGAPQLNRDGSKSTTTATVEAEADVEGL